MVAAVAVQDAAPNSGGVRPANGFAIFVRFDKLETDGAHVSAQIERFDVEQVPQTTPLRSGSCGNLDLEIGRLLANFEPIEKGVGRFEPDREPVRDFFFLGALGRVHFVIARDHFRAAAPQARHFANAFGGGLLVFGEKFSQQLIQAHQAHFGFVERGKMEKIAELLFVLTFGIRLRGPSPRACPLLRAR